MAGRTWRRWSLALGGWFVSPSLVIAAVGLIWSALAGLPPVLVALVTLAALVLALAGTYCLLALWDRFGARKRRKQIAEELTRQAHGFASCLRACAQEAAGESGVPTPEQRVEAGDWHRSFPGNQADQDKAVAEVLRDHREPLCRLFDEAASVEIPVSAERGLLERLSTIEGAWELHDRIMVLAKTWAEYSPVEEVPQVIPADDVHPVPSRSELLEQVIECGDDLLAKAKSGNFFSQDLGMETGSWVGRCAEVIPEEFLDLYHSLSNDGRSGPRGPHEPDKGIERRLIALREIARRIGSPADR